MQVVHLLVEHAVGLAGVDFERTQRVGDFVHHVAAVQRVEDAEEEVDIHLQPGFGVRLVEAAGLLEQEHAEAVEPGIAQRQAVFGFVHAEAAGSASAGGEEDVPVDDFLLGNALLFERLQILHQVADGEVSRIALAVVAVLLAGLERLDVRGGHGFGAIAEAFEGAMHQFLVLPGQSAEKEGRLGALVLGERRFSGTLEVMHLPFGHTGFPFQAGAFFREPLLDGVFNGGADLYEVGRRLVASDRQSECSLDTSFPVWTQFAALND